MAIDKEVFERFNISGAEVKNSMIEKLGRLIGLGRWIAKIME